MSDRLKIRPIGNSACVVLSKEMLAELGVEIGDELQAVRTAKGFEISAFDADLDDALRWIEKGAKRYRNTLRALSK
ncbi:MAG: AbrB/MazE/SpoVT family DNA-binding domain-containing protein [Marinicaulis sp.]|nr:AbrB/MazE/SpoVT family DNA-binding domain-containing protein [Marinicaulis sp.]NNL89384.1 AbrB/MazE/SpoVT family DNA-binding domain-containing protein [Marinicaulis sp.]